MSDPFKRIAEKAIQEAERVPVDFETFKRGLVTIWHEINERVEMENVNPRDPDMFDEE